MPVETRADLRAKALASGIPERMIGGLERYVFDRVQPGDFWMAVLSNDLVRTFDLADAENSEKILAYVRFLYNDLPSTAWGSPEKVRDWLRQQRVGSFYAEAEQS